MHIAPWLRSPISVASPQAQFPTSWVGAGSSHQLSAGPRRAGDDESPVSPPISRPQHILRGPLSSEWAASLFQTESSPPVFLSYMARAHGSSALTVCSGWFVEWLRECLGETPRERPRVRAVPTKRGTAGGADSPMSPEKLALSRATSSSLAHGLARGPAILFLLHNSSNSRTGPSLGPCGRSAGEAAVPTAQGCTQRR